MTGEIKGGMKSLKPLYTKDFFSKKGRDSAIILQQSLCNCIHKNIAWLPLSRLFNLSVGKATLKHRKASV